MATIKQIGMAAGTFSVALGIGFVMQNGDALANRFGADNAAPEPAPFTADAAAEEVVVQASLDTTPDPVDEPIAIQPAQNAMAFAPDPMNTAPEVDPELAVILPEAAAVPSAPEAPVQMASIDPDISPDIEADIATETPIEAAVETETDCVPSMMAVPGSAATVAVAISAPCHINMPFTIHHQGMMFTTTTDENGVAKMTVPALAEVAVMIAAFEDGDGAVATTAVPDFASYDRAVLQWQGNTSVMLSAYEGDANFGDDNHIHATNPGDVARLEAAEGGYLLRLGDETAPDALIAEVYTFPTGVMGAGLDVMLVAEAEITDENCGQELNAQSIQVSPTGNTSALDLTMVMPDCDAVGDFLILQNMFEDLTLASR